MNLIISNKLFNMRKSSKVLDEEDNVAYIVKGKIIGSSKKIMDLEKNILYKVKNNPFHFIHRSAYVCDSEGNRLMLVKDNKIVQGFVIIDETDTYSLEWGGWLSGMTNTVKKNGEVLGVIKKKIRFKDTFEVNFENKEDAPLLIAITIAIDNIIDKMKD